MADKLCAFHALLVQANARMNLTRVSDDPDEAIDRNYLDSLAPLELVRGAQSCVDVGSGAGFPGIPLSIFLPQTRFVLLEAQARRVEFLREAICRLRLNAEAVCMRAEDAARAPWREAFDCAVSRAVAPLRVLCELTLPLVRVGGRVVACKGPSAREEAEQAANALALLGGATARVLPVDIPGRDWEHTLVVLEKTSPTPDKYPRRAGIPEKRPL